MNLHICLVSDQLLANYIPVMMARPDQVHLVSSAYMLKKANYFEAMLQQQGFKVVRHNGIPDTAITAIRDYAQQLWNDINSAMPNANITLNITGGNKLMALAMWEVFNGAVEQIIYTDTQNNRIENLHDQTEIPLKSVLDIPQYLQAQSVKYLQSASDDPIWLVSVQQRKAISKYLASHMEQLGRFIGGINGLVFAALSKDGKMLLEPCQMLSDAPRGIQREALLKLQNAHLLSWDGNREITFLDVERARYLGGIWLEEYVYLVARDASPEHVACSVKINWQSSKQATNELDVILVHRNRMLVIECKTLRFGNNEQKDSDIVYKISDLGDELRGLFGKTWLVSARKPSQNLIDRAKSRSLDIIAPEQLKDLRCKILDWMQF